MRKFVFLLLLSLFAICSISAVQITKADSASKAVDSSYQTSDYNAMLMQKLSPEQLYELEKYRSWGPNSDEPKLSSGGIVLISLMPFLTAILIVFFVIRNKRMKELRMI